MIKIQLLTVAYREENIQHVFILESYKVVGFVLNGSGISLYRNVQHSDDGIKIMTFILSSEKKNELKNMQNFLPKIFPEKNQDYIHTIHSSVKKFRLHLAMLFFKSGSWKGSLAYQNIIPSLTWNESERAQKIAMLREETNWFMCGSSDDVINAADAMHRNYLRSWVIFVNKYHHLSKQKNKEMIKSLADVPTFAKSIDLDDGDLLKVLVMFVSMHICESPGCDSYSYLKCGDCKVSHYCNVQCQERDFARHKDSCEAKSRYRTRVMAMPYLLQVVLMKMYQKPVITFETFSRVLQVKIYETFHRILRTTGFRHLHLRTLPQEIEHKSEDKVLCLLKMRRNVRTLRCLKIQLENAFGNTNSFAVFFLQDAEEAVAHLTKKCICKKK